MTKTQLPVWREPMLLLVLPLLVLVAHVLQAAGRPPSSKDVEALRAEVKALVMDVDQLAAPYLSTGEDGHVWLSFDSFQAVADALNRPAPYTVRMDGLSSVGGFIGEMWKCDGSCVVVTSKIPKSGQDAGWGVYPQSGQNLSGTLTIANVRLDSRPGQPGVLADAAANLRIPLTLSLVPCAGATVAWDDGMAAAANSTLRVALQPVKNADNSISLRAAVVSPASIPVSVRLLRLQPGQELSTPSLDLADVFLDTRIPDQLTGSGEIRFPEGFQPKTLAYHLGASLVDVQYRGMGYLLRYGVHVDAGSGR